MHPDNLEQIRPGDEPTTGAPGETREPSRMPLKPLGAFAVTVIVILILAVILR